MVRRCIVAMDVSDHSSGANRGWNGVVVSVALSGRNKIEVSATLGTVTVALT